MLQSKDTGKLKGQENKTTYMLSPGDAPKNERYTQTERKGMEKDISCKWKILKS